MTSGVKKQAGVSTQPLYKLVNLKGGGLLVDMMKRACQNKQYAEIDHAIKTKVSVKPRLDLIFLEIPSICIAGNVFRHIFYVRFGTNAIQFIRTTDFQSENISTMDFSIHRLNHFCIIKELENTFQSRKLYCFEMLSVQDTSSCRKFEF